ncbi:MAG: LexA family transcriptional regulator [Ruminococcus sp.]|nr:LexA family transcriptional regulator [Ruminococcus sp.]
MKIGDFLQKYIERADISQAELARQSGVPASTISSIINRNNDRVAIEMLLKLCEALDCDINEYIDSFKKNEDLKSKGIDFSHLEYELINKYRSLDEYGQKAVDDLIENEYKRCEDNKAVFMFRKLSANKASAGTGFDLNNPDEWQEIEVVDTPEARKADFAVRVEGASMEPDYYDGDIVYISLASELPVGQVGLFIQNGKGYIKEAGKDCIISRNPDYDNIFPSDGDIECKGKVIGVAELPI